ncbi:MAG: winged helix-turn-helix transcriptional regulator [Flavobacteriales bacterium]|nr:winged helix-turn-helix transcriptional regulator [Flavobacteriales bacterium]
MRKLPHELTEKGKELLPIFDSMADWGMYLVEDYKRSMAC